MCFIFFSLVFFSPIPSFHRVLVRRVFGVLLGKKSSCPGKQHQQTHTNAKAMFFKRSSLFFTLRLRLKDLFSAFVMLEDETGFDETIDWNRSSLNNKRDGGKYEVVETFRSME